MCMSYKLVGLIDPKTGSIDPKSRISKINKRKKVITYSFEAQIASHFFQYLKDIIIFREIRVHLVPLL